MSQRKPTATRDEVKEVFLELLEENETTTSLEVKEELRNRGFWATQQEIGPLVRDIGDEEGTYWDFNGSYRTYHLEVPPSQPNVPIYSAPVVNTPGLIPVTYQTSTAPKIPIDPADRKPLNQPEDGCWECSCPGNYRTEYFSSKLTAGQARYAYEKISGAMYVNIRSKKYVA